MINMTDFTLLIEAYLTLLKLSHGASRDRLNPVLAQLREEIVRNSDWSAEQVQVHCEGIVAEMQRLRGSVTWQCQPKT